jgi:hypothetical protein
MCPIMRRQKPITLVLMVATQPWWLAGTVGLKVDKGSGLLERAFVNHTSIAS